MSTLSPPRTPPISSRVLRAGVLVALSSLVLAAATADVASAAKVGAPRAIKRKVKRVKRTLVDIEFKLDEAKAGIDRVRRESRHLAGDVRTARAELAEAPSERGFLPDFQTLGPLVRLSTARSQRRALTDRLASVRQRQLFVLAERDEQIGRLETLVQQSRRESAERLPNWSLDGSLITYSADWEAVSLCESSGRWFINTGLFDGGLQFLPSTWIGFGGGVFARYAYQATKKQQIAIAERVLAVQGSKAWPNCFRPLPFHF